MVRHTKTRMKPVLDNSTLLFIKCVKFTKPNVLFPLILEVRLLKVGDTIVTVELLVSTGGSYHFSSAVHRLLLQFR